MCFHLINSISVEYHGANLFHGDIKTENFFFIDDNRFTSTSDVGSLLDLGHE